MSTPAHERGDDVRVEIVLGGVLANQIQ